LCQERIRFTVPEKLVHKKIGGKRSQVLGSTFRVRNKDKIEEPKCSQKMLVLPHNCQMPCSRFVGICKRSVFRYKTFTK